MPYTKQTWANWDDSKSDEANAAAGALLDAGKMDYIEDNLTVAYDAASAPISEKQVVSSMIQDGAVTSDKIKGPTSTISTITTNKLADSSVSGNSIFVIVDPMLEDASITSEKFIDGSITASKVNLIDGISVEDIPAGSLTSSKFATTALPIAGITREKVEASLVINTPADNSITSESVTTFAYISGDKVASQSVTAAKLTGTFQLPIYFELGSVPGSKLLDDTVWFDDTSITALPVISSCNITLTNTGNKLTGATGTVSFADGSAAVTITANITDN